jgi:hypothetical protein
VAIRKIEIAEFRHIRGEENPADLITRGLTGAEMGNCQMWWSGPIFLKTPVTDWPKKNEVPMMTSAELQKIEISKSAPMYHPGIREDRPVFREGRPAKSDAGSSGILADVVVLAKGVEESADRFPCGLNPEDHSSLRRLLRKTVWSLKFVKKVVWNQLSEETCDARPELKALFERISDDASIFAEEIRAARSLWIKWIQKKHFGDVTAAIETKRKHCLVSQLNLQIDDAGLIRCCGRLEYAQLPLEAIEPVLLPKRDHFTDLVIKEVHGQLLHSGTNQTLSQLRIQYWIPAGRQVVMKIVRRCLVCRKCRGPCYALPDASVAKGTGHSRETVRLHRG